MSEENYMFIHIISIVGSRYSLESNYDCFKTMVTKLVPLLWPCISRDSFV